MASKSAIGRIQAQAMSDLAAAMQQISHAVGVKPLAIEQIHYRDPDYQDAMRMTSLAAWAGEIAATLNEIVATVKTEHTPNQAELIAQIEVPAEGALDLALPFEVAVEPEPEQPELDAEPETEPVKKRSKRS